MCIFVFGEYDGNWMLLDLLFPFFSFKVCDLVIVIDYLGEMAVFIICFGEVDYLIRLLIYGFYSV